LEVTILYEPRGSGGFGYDPITQPLGMDKTTAELTLQEKNAISHRGQMIRKFLKALENR